MSENFEELSNAKPDAAENTAGALLSGTGHDDSHLRNIARLLDVELEVIVRFGSTEMPLKDVARVGTGTMIELNRSVDDPVELYVNGRPLARGEVVVVDGYYGVRITEICAPAERALSRLSGDAFDDEPPDNNRPDSRRRRSRGSRMYLLPRAVLRFRRESRNTLAVVIQMEAEIADLSRDLDAATQRATDLARRVAWLESRQRSAAETLVEQVAQTGDGLQAQNKLNMTERRHRVLTLARRGLDAQAVASTLGLPHGEVELIIGLSRAA